MTEQAVRCEVMTNNQGLPERLPKAGRSVDRSRQSSRFKTAAGSAQPADQAFTKGKRVSEIKVFTPQLPSWADEVSPSPAAPAAQSAAPAVAPTPPMPPAATPAINLTPPQPEPLSPEAIPKLRSQLQDSTLQDSSSVDLLDSSTDSAIVQIPVRPQSRRRRWQWSGVGLFRSWQFWSIMILLLLGGIGGLSLAVLLKIPALPNCPSIFWPTASASLRLYCAQLAANKENTKDLLEAIDLVKDLPVNHPLRPEIDRSIEDWSLMILDLAEDTFQEGNLQAAIDTARQIPTHTQAHTQIEGQIERWQSIWKDAEEIFAEAKAALAQEDLPQAFRIGLRLHSLGNTYWKTTKFEELNSLIEVARQDSSKLNQARELADIGGVENLQEALRLAEEIHAKSPIYPSARKAIGEFGQRMYDLAEVLLQEGDSQQAIALARLVPPETGIDAKVQDFINLALAEAEAWEGTLAGLESAIIQAQRLERDRPLYDRAQELIERWQMEIGDLNRLRTARQYAARGGLNHLRAAIAEAQQISASNSRSQDIQEEIYRWAVEVETLEDRPILERAQLLARNGDIRSLQSAIDEASQISESRALYSEARQVIDRWSGQIERLQYRPRRDRTRREFANNQNSPAPRNPQPTQSNWPEPPAPPPIAAENSQFTAQQLMQDAYDIALAATPEAWLSAIGTAEQVPENTSSRIEADQMINVWSQSVLDYAIRQSAYDLAGAIAIASSIPTRTEAYAAAQLQIQTWNQLLQTPPAPEEVPPTQFSQ